MCNGGACTCREVGAAADGGAGVPIDAGRKRFELRMGPSPRELWMRIGDDTFYKSAERAEECFYIDLPSGDAPVELRASSPEGVSAAWTIRELGTTTKSWYDTFAFGCGSPGVCSFEELDAQRSDKSSAKVRGVGDRCGSVKVKGLSWDTGHAPDQLHPSELVVRLRLAIYKFAPTKPHGDDSCGKGRPPKPGAAPDDVPSAD